MGRLIHVTIFLIVAFTLISCGPSQSERATQTQASVHETAVSAASTQQYISIVERKFHNRCLNDEISSLEAGVPPEGPEIAWFIEYYPSVPGLKGTLGSEYAIQIPTGERIFPSDITEAEILLCVHRFRVKYEPDCVYNQDWLLKPIEPKTLPRIRIVHEAIQGRFLVVNQQVAAEKIALPAQDAD